MVRVLLLPGSPRVGSMNATVLRTAAAVAPPEIETVLRDGAARLPHFNPDNHPEGGPVGRGRGVRRGHGIAFLAGHLTDEGGAIVATATATATIRPSG